MFLALLYTSNMLKVVVVKGLIGRGLCNAADCMYGDMVGLCSTLVTSKKKGSQSQDMHANNDTGCHAHRKVNFI